MKDAARLKKIAQVAEAHGDRQLSTAATTAAQKHNKNINKETIMADDKNKQKPAQTNAKPAAPPTAKTAATTPAAKSTAAAATDAPKSDKKPKSKRDRVRLVSTTVSGFWVRAYKDIVDKYGLPKGPDGVELIVRAGVSPVGQKLTDAEKAARKAEKDQAAEAKKAEMAGWSDEQKLEFATKQREAKAAAKTAKKKAEMDALRAILKAEILEDEAKKAAAAAAATPAA